MKEEIPHYIPDDIELWPVFHEAIVRYLDKHPEAHRAVLEASRPSVEN